MFSLFARRPAVLRPFVRARPISSSFRGKAPNITLRLLFFVHSRPLSTPSTMASPGYVAKKVTDIAKSPFDLKEYRGIELANGLRVLLVSDPTTDKSAAAMDVSCGHLMDPWEMPGTAHFCEHMLFLGTDKYPSENEYNKFIDSNAGKSNAYTSTDHTNYHFDVKPEELEGALDRFVQFFLKPQFTESATSREVLAVDSEHTNNLKMDNWRQLQVERSMSKPGHDLGKFGTGNKQTLEEAIVAKGLEPREELLKFHKKWYSSNTMSCVIIGKESLDELEKLVEKLQFDRIENKHVERKVWTEHPYGSEQVGRRVQIVPIKDSRSLKISFPTRDIFAEYKTQPDHYLSHLIGHEGKGSLLSELKRLGWASSLYCGQKRIANGIANFEVVCDLSKDGLEHVEEIIELVFHYIALLRKEGTHQWVYEELKELGNNTFLFKDKEQPFRAVTSLSPIVQLIPFEDILTCTSTMPQFDPAGIQSILEHLTPENMFYRVVSKKFAGEEGNTTEPIYGTEIRIDDIPGETMERFRKAMREPHEAFALPEKNEYIPTQFALKTREDVKSEHPRVIYDDEWTRVWFKQDDEYKLPKMVTAVSLTSPMVDRCPRSALLSFLYLMALEDGLGEETYNASLAGLRFHLAPSQSGVVLEVSGYDEKQPLYVRHLVKRLVNFVPDEVRFNVLFDSVKRSLQNFAHSQPYVIGQHLMKWLLAERSWTKEQLLAVCKDISAQDVSSLRDQMLQAFHVEVIAHGNTTEKEVLAMAGDVTAILKDTGRYTRPLFVNEYAPLREHALEHGDCVLFRHYQTTHQSSCVRLLYQAGVQNTKDDAMVSLVHQLLKESAFNQLRTNEQLGYIVASAPRLSNGTLGFQIIVQGKYEPDFVLSRIEAFLENAKKEIVDMSEAEFNCHVEGLISHLLEKPKTLKAQYKEYLAEIENRHYDFDRSKNEVEVLRQVKKSDVIEFFDRKLAQGAPESRKVGILVHGNADTPTSQRTKRESAAGDDTPRTEVECLHRVRDGLSLFARPKAKLNLRPFGVDFLQNVGSKL